MKEEDYINRDNDPMVTGGCDDGVGCTIAAVFVLGFITGLGVLIGIFLSQ